jgi:hypothetical protein
MIIDEVVLDKIIHLQKAYPSRSEDIDFLTNETNTYFSKHCTEERVSLLCQAMIDKKVAGCMLYPYYPLLLFFSNPYKDGRKIIFDKTAQLEDMKIFKKLCIGFGFSSHLKKHGNSDRRVFRILPSFKELDLENVKHGKKDPACNWEEIWNYLIASQYFEAKEHMFWCIKNTTLKFPMSFWKKALKNFNSPKLNLKVKKYYRQTDKNIIVEFEKMNNPLL